MGMILELVDGARMLVENIYIDMGELAFYLNDHPIDKEGMKALAESIIGSGPNTNASYESLVVQYNHHIGNEGGK